MLGSPVFVVLGMIVEEKMKPPENMSRKNWEITFGGRRTREEIAQRVSGKKYGKLIMIQE